MENSKIIVDYLTFSIKPKIFSDCEMKDVVFTGGNLNEEFILSYLLKLGEYKDSFVLLSGLNGYKSRLSYGGINVC